MTHQLDVARGRNIVARWHAMAEQRLEYLTELFESGRWRRFHSEASFLENIEEAKAAVQTWSDLLTREASKNNSAIDISWLGAPRTKLPLAETVRARARSIPLQPSQTPLAPLPRGVLAVTEAPIDFSGAALPLQHSEEPVPDHLSRLTFDMPAIPDRSAIPDRVLATSDRKSAIQDRYPLLHNAL